MEVLQYEVVAVVDDGFVVAVWDEALKAFVRLSKEVYRQFEQAYAALFSGSWSIG